MHTPHPFRTTQDMIRKPRGTADAALVLNAGLGVKSDSKDLGHFREGYESDEREEEEKACRYDSPVANLGQLILQQRKDEKNREKARGEK